MWMRSSLCSWVSNPYAKEGQNTEIIIATTKKTTWGRFRKKAPKEIVAHDQPCLTTPIVRTPGNRLQSTHSEVYHLPNGSNEEKEVRLPPIKSTNQLKRTHDNVGPMMNTALQSRKKTQAPEISRKNVKRSFLRPSQGSCRHLCSNCKFFSNFRTHCEAFEFCL